MAEKTKFQYAKSPTGALSGASFIQQTEDAINDIGGKLVEYNAISEETKRKAEQAISTSETALNTANQALTQSAQAIETANTAKAQSDSAVTESRAAKEAAEAAQLDAEESARDAESSRQAAEDANEAAQAAAQRAQTAQDTAETAQENAYAARQAASQAQESATRAEANALLAQSQAAESAAAAEALADGVVRYDSSQTLNASQKTQARTNIGAADASDTYTKAEVDAKVSSALIFKGSVATYDDLPTDGNVTGDMWNVLDTGANYAWTGEAWDKLSETIDLTPYLTKSDAANTYLKKTDNAVSASKLQTSRRISATGDATWSVGFNGTQDESGTLTLAASGATAGSYGPSAAATLSFGGSFNVPYVTVDAKGRVTAIKHFALKLPAAPTSVSGNAGTATRLQNTRTISATGDGTWSVSFNGSANASGEFTLAASGATAGSYGESAAKTLSYGGSFSIPYVTVDAKGRVTNVKSIALKMPSAQTDVTGNAETATKLETARKINGVAFDGSKDISIDLLASAGRVTALEGTTQGAQSGLQMYEAYNNGYPENYGNVLHLKAKEGTNHGECELFLGWSGTTGAHAPIYVRNRRDTTSSAWSDWKKVYTEGDSVPGVNAVGNQDTTGNAGTATKLKTARSLKVNLATTAADSFDGSGNADAIGVSGTLPTGNGGTGRTDGKVNALATKRTIDGMQFDGSANIHHYAECSTAAATAAKTVTLSGFTLATGARIIVRFTVTNTASNPTLNVNGTGAKAIQYRNAAISAGYLAANRLREFVYDGSAWELIGDVDTNTTYSVASQSEAEAGTNNSKMMTPLRVKQAITANDPGVLQAFLDFADDNNIS